MNLALFLGVNLLGVSYSQGKIVSLQEAYQAALEKTEVLAHSESQLREVEAQGQGVRGNFFPNLSASANYQRQSNPMAATNQYDQGSAKLSLTQSLYAGGRDRVHWKAAQSKTTAQKYEILNTKNNLYREVVGVFYAVLAAEREVENIKKSIELTIKRSGELRRRKKIGQSRSIEILAAESQHSVLEAQLLGALGELQRAKNNFFNITGLDQNTKMQETRTLPQEVESLQELLKKVESRPDILSLQTLVETQEFLVKGARSRYFPTLDFSANYYLGRYHYPSTAPDWDAAITLTLPLFSGGITQAGVREAEEKKIQARLLLREGKRRAETEIHTSYSKLLSAVEQVKALEKAVLTTEQNYKEQEKDYRYRLATNLDVLQALNTLHETKRTLDKTRYQALSAAAEMKAVVNELEP